MFMLVRFEDDIYYVCRENRVSSVKGSACTVKYTDGGRYPARILARNVDQSILNRMKKEVENDPMAIEDKVDCAAKQRKKKQTKQKKSSVNRPETLQKTIQSQALACDTISERVEENTPKAKRVNQQKKKKREDAASSSNKCKKETVECDRPVEKLTDIDEGYRETLNDAGHKEDSSEQNESHNAWKMTITPHDIKFTANQTYTSSPAAPSIASSIEIMSELKKSNENCVEKNGKWSHYPPGSLPGTGESNVQSIQSVDEEGFPESSKLIDAEEKSPSSVQEEPYNDTDYNTSYDVDSKIFGTNRKPSETRVIENVPSTNNQTMKQKPVNETSQEPGFNVTYSVPARVCDIGDDIALQNIRNTGSPTNSQSTDNAIKKNIQPLNGNASSDMSHFNELSYGGVNESSDPPILTEIMSYSTLTTLLAELGPRQPATDSSSIVDQSSVNLAAGPVQIIQDEQNTYELSHQNFVPSGDITYIATEVTVQSDTALNETILQAMERPLIFSTPNDTGISEANGDDTEIRDDMNSTLSDDVTRSPKKNASRYDSSPDRTNFQVQNIDKSLESNLQNAEIFNDSFTNRTESRVCTIDESSQKRVQDPQYSSDSNPSDESSDGSNYVPSIHASENDTDNSGNEEEANETFTRKRTAKRNSGQNSSLEVSLSANIPGKSTRDDAEMFVTVASGKKGLDRRSFCMYCQKMQSKFVRHLENKHKDVNEVKKFSVLPKKNPERLKIIDTIRKKCMFEFNTNNAVNDGELMVVRRPNEKAPRTATNYKLCQNCKGFFSKDNLRHHAKRCFGFDGKRHRTLSVLGRRILGRIHAEASDMLRKDVFPILREDEIVRLIRYDRLVILYGNKLCAKYGSLRHQHDMIRSHLRHLGRFLHAMKSINDEITDFASVYHPKFYDDAVLAIYKVSGFDPKTKTYEAPATAYAIGSLLKKVANYYIFDCIKREDLTQKARTEDFLKLLNVDIEVSVNKNVTESQTLQKRRKKVELPSDKDIQTLHNYLKNERTSAFAALQKGFDASEWQKLAESTLISIQLFNRRRPGEIERASIEDFQTYQGIDKEELKKLSKESQEIAKNYVRFTIRGKKGRTVPVLLTMDHFNCIEKILQYRKEAKVEATNEYVFGIQHSKTAKPYMRACNLMRKFATASGVTFPHRLRGTTLRKHIATNCINLNLSENEVADVANFMGHAEKIHREHYRQPIVSREILRMSRVLELAQGGDGDDDDDEDDEDEEDSASETEEVMTTARGEKATPSNEKIYQSAKVAKVGKKRSHTKMVQENAAKTGTYDEDSESDTLKTPTIAARKKQKKRSTSPYGPVRSKKRWSTADKEKVQNIFASYFKSRTLPSLSAITKACSNYPSLQARSPAVIKSWISNQYKK